MKLHTDFHDYYDNAVGYGINKNVHYNRFTLEVEIEFKAHRYSSFVIDNRQKPTVQKFKSCESFFSIIELVIKEFYGQAEFTQKNDRQSSLKL